ncbi:MAG: CHASE2 domain-containing protein [Ignavibacteria bacterium]|nr:CHASE2 domain-containing protein [Ignavibacteria bacterium]
MNRLTRILLSFDNLMITALTCGVIALFYFVPGNFDFLNPITQAIGDVDLTDMVFSKFRDESKVKADTNIVLVNIGYANRSEIAEIIRKVQGASPAVIGVDAFFRAPKDSLMDSELASAMSDCEKLVLVSKAAFASESFEGTTDAWAESSVDASAEFDTLETSNPMFMQNASTGFANFIIDQGASFMTCREVSFQEQVKSKTEPSFALRIADVFKPEAAGMARLRGDRREIINYCGNIGSFYSVDVDQIMESDFDAGFMSGKIVLLGFMGPTLSQRSFDDNFYTPLNERYAGRSYPDMYGVVIHANIVSMILSGNYIDGMSTNSSLILGFIVLVLNVMLFTYIFTNYNEWYDMVAVVIQLSQSVIILFLIVFVFDKFDYKLALTPALVGVALLGTMHDLYQDSMKKVILMFIARVKNRKKPASS